MKHTVLIVEDDANIRDGLVDVIASEGFLTLDTGSVAQTRELKQTWDVCLLDWKLPDGQGIELLKEWRRAGNFRPVIMLTARVEVIDKVLGLELGASDYVTKPFEPRELVARIHARLRDSVVEQGSPDNTIVRYGPIAIDRRSMRVSLHDDPIEVTNKEYLLLLFMVENADQVYTRDELLDKVWGYESYPTTRTVDTHILQLRQKFGAQFFETVRSVGYRFVSSEKHKLTKT